MNDEKSNNTDNHLPYIRFAQFRFYEELNDFLPKEWEKTTFPFSFTGTPSVKNIIEAIGVPHAEIDLIIVNGVSVKFDYLLKGGEKVSVYPVFETFDISSINRLRKKTLRNIQFIVDVNLGKLAKKLRLLGFDTLFQNDYDDNQIVEIAFKEKRIILTRDKGVLKYSKVTHGYWIRNDDPKKQLIEVIEKFQLQNHFNPFTRCSNCNGVLHSIEKKSLEGRVKSDTLKIFDNFWECADCKKIYWEGSHVDRIYKWLKNLDGK